MQNFSKYHAYLLGFFSLIVFFANLWGFPIYILDEAKNASCAREMWEQGEWIVPTYNYNLRTDKPPLHYYFMMLAFEGIGVSAFAARFFSALAGTATVLITFAYTKRHLNALSGFLAGLVLIGSIHFVLQNHLAVPDPYLICTMTLAFFAFFTGIYQNKVGQLYLAYAATALAVLSKGILPIGLIGLTFLLLLIFTKRLNWTQIKALRLVRGGLLFLAIALPWYILVGQATDGAWLRGFFLDHNFGRFASEMEGHGGPFFLPLVYVLVGLLPFAVFLPQTMRWAWRSKHQAFILFCLLTAVVIVGFFSISATKLPNYTVPAYPFLAVLLGGFFAHLSQKQTSLKAYRLGWSLSVLLIVGLSLVAIGFFPIPDLENVSAAVLSLSFAPIPIAALLGLYFIKKRKLLQGFFALAIGGIACSLMVWYLLIPQLSAGNSVERTASYIQSTDPIAYFRRMNRAFAFQLKRRIEPLETQAEVEKYFQDHPDGKLLTIKRYLPTLDSLANPPKILYTQKDLFENTTTVLLVKE